MIYRDADGGGEFGGDLGGFQFSQREASPQPNLGVVLLRLAPDQGSELVRGPRRVRGRLRGAFYRRDFFLTGWLNQDLMWSGPRLDVCHFLWKCWLGMILLCLTMVASLCQRLRV